MIFLSQLGLAPIQTFCDFLIEKRHQSPNLKALKMIANCIFGLFGNNRFSLYSSMTATAITKNGRYILERAIRFLREKFQISCLYGDTDSMFLKLDQKDPSLVVSEYNASFPQIKLKVEAHFERIIFLRKKLYFGKLLNNDFKFSGFSAHFLSLYRKFMCSLISTLDEEALDERRRLMLNIFFESSDKDGENYSELFWNSYIRPLLVVMRNDKMNNYKSLNYTILSLDFNRQEAVVMSLSHVYFPSKYTQHLTLKNKQKHDCIIFARFTQEPGSGIFFLELVDAPQSVDKRFHSLRQLENQVLIPLLGKAMVEKTLLHIHPLKSSDSSGILSLSLFLAFIFPEIAIRETPVASCGAGEPPGGTCLVLPFDVLVL